MKSIVLFRSKSEDYQKAFHDQNYEVIFVEPLQFAFINTDQLAQKLLQNNYDGIILTSPRAIEAISKCWDPTKFVLWSAKRVYTVGEASSHKIKLCLGLEALGMSSGNAQNLAKIIINENGNNSKFLFPCGNFRSESLPDMLQASKITVESLSVYETKENENLRTDLMELNNSESLRCMAFFSPSGCEYIFRQLQTFNNRLSALPHFAIGNSTAHKIENLGVEVAGVAVSPQATSLAAAVQHYFTSIQTS